MLNSIIRIKFDLILLINIAWINGYNIYQIWGYFYKAKYPKSCLLSDVHVVGDSFSSYAKHDWSDDACNGEGDADVPQSIDDELISVAVELGIADDAGIAAAESSVLSVWVACADSSFEAAALEVIVFWECDNGNNNQDNSQD